MMKRYLIFFTTLFFLNSMTFADIVAPVDMLRTVTQNSINQLTTYKKSHADQKTIPFSVIYKVVQEQLLPHVAVDTMLQSILAKQCHYAKPQAACEPIDFAAVPATQKKELHDQFVYMMVSLYASALGEADKYQILFRKSRQVVEAKPGAMMEVDSQVVIPDTEPVRITYQLTFQQNEWKVYDFSINGAISVISNLRAQFAPVLQQQGVPGLIDMLKKHNATVSK